MLDSVSEGAPVYVIAFPLGRVILYNGSWVMVVSAGPEPNLHSKVKLD